ncbi:hypothetical protein DP145_01640 [Clostridium tetani]|uniref:Uncharacterized protein n=1 Tax=Clostridium tetani TaxID=1513 RepID=A0ABC8ECJ7_CLOTA|nr:hypothetical protein [Clostridium tetani]RXI46068.1 hypothetical protein DP126_07720 [Clostridium tetani]RXM61460.1 hypothetical protein DP138_04555 [Clostridium tetani]RXM70285.1 hypothetical protein DP145_01640 [Clostridium tetani]BDR66705.1 hypothetical protein K144312032_09330 [Clostridium tetani]BDR80676.1 hypothetical protein K234311028_09220 [Clostridium tetani]
MNRLWMIIKMLEENGGIRNMFLHRNYYSGELELNIEFKNDKIDEDILLDNIDEVDSCAFWE